MTRDSARDSFHRNLDIITIFWGLIATRRTVGVSDLVCGTIVSVKRIAFINRTFTGRKPSPSERHMLILG